MRRGARKLPRLEFSRGFACLSGKERERVVIDFFDGFLVKQLAVIDYARPLGSWGRQVLEGIKIDAYILDFTGNLIWSSIN